MQIVGLFLWYAAVVAAISIAERRWPAGARPRLKDQLFNFGLAFAVATVVALAGPVLAYVPEQLHTYGLLGLVFGSFSLEGWWEIALLAVAYLVVWDFFQYWCHRILHSSATLWPVHALHHEEECLNSSTALRNTLSQGVLQFFAVYVPTIIVCGTRIDQLPILIFIASTFGFYNHANVRLNLGLFSYVISGPQWHRLHHGVPAELHDKNFAAFFPVLDLIFGTLRMPKAQEFPVTGLSDRRRTPLTPLGIPMGMLGMRADLSIRPESPAIAPTVTTASVTRAA